MYNRVPGGACGETFLQIVGEGTQAVLDHQNGNPKPLEAFVAEYSQESGASMLRSIPSNTPLWIINRKVWQAIGERMFRPSPGEEAS